MPCWSCEADPGDGPLCASCGAVQPLPPGATPFRVLGLPETFAIDASAVEEAFKALNRRLHPDRFAQKSPRERRLSLEWTTAVNDAVRTLKDPSRRAAWLLRARGLDIDHEPGGGRGRMGPELLEAVLEQREALGEARARRDLAQVRKLGAEAKARASVMEARLAAAFAGLEGGDATALDSCASTLAGLRYEARFQEEVAALELEELEGAT